MLFGIALTACVCGLVLSDVLPKLRTDLRSFDSTIDKMERPHERREGRNT